MPLQEPGTLGLQLECTLGTHIVGASLSIVDSQVASRYRERWLAKQAVASIATTTPP